MLKKAVAAGIVAALSLFFVPGLAGAHATVQPRVVTAGSYEVFVLRVPNEKEVPTVEVRVEVPEGFAVSRVKPVPGWNYEFTRGADGRTVTAITWSGGKILDGEFQDFEFQGKTHATPGRYAWRVYQTYEGGEVVAWAGASDSNTPASFMEVRAGEAVTDAHGQEQAPPAPTAPAPAPAPAADPAAAQAPAAAASPLTTGAAYGGLVLGAAALVLSLRRR